MKDVREKTKTACSKIWEHGFTQIVIDLVQDDIEELFDGEPSGDDICSKEYQVGLLLDAINPAYKKDVELLTELKSLLGEWGRQHGSVNRILGISPEL